ncbi:MAG: vitamin B12-dependent ribonucleotide reductase [Candidatus Zixiibacteriota bacterium]|nr:MAG: vitamin B12-dependent ribonucleotide reductase [candidate division Zixibacteria bacterium]
MALREEIELSDNALMVLQRRYLLKDRNGIVVESPRELFVRVARCVAEADRLYGSDDASVESTVETFFNLMTSLEFLPNSPTLMNAGRPRGQLSACFVLPVGDSMEEIFETNKHAALIHKSGGGTGFSFSRLRPRNSVVASTSGIASGPVSFMKVYDASTEAIKQGGARRGANMGILRVDHPDIMEFIACKEDISEVTNFNISVAITDDFMAALRKDASYPLYNPYTEETHQVDGKPVLLSAEEVWSSIVDHAWRTGEPGIIFIDRMNRMNPTAPSETIEATNPCGEQPLPAYDSCNLGSINLGRFVSDPLPQQYNRDTPDNGIDWTRLARTVRDAVHFLDNVIDRNHYPIPQIESQTRKNRRVGLGVMGWADMLVKLSLSYGEAAARSLAGRVMKFVHDEARNQSSELVRSRGKFPNWEGSVFHEDGLAMRNATVTTIAPTGTLSIIAGCSSGIEPYYSLLFERNVLDGTRLLEVNPLLAEKARRSGFYSDRLLKDLAGKRSIADVREIPEEVRRLFVTASDLEPADHVLMQAAFQEHCDSSVSKTINLAASASPDDVRAAFELAYDSGCKGVTVYRDRSRPHQVLTSPSEVDLKEPAPPSATAKADSVAPRPLVLTGFTEKIRTGYGNLYVTVNLRDGKPFEVFAQIGKSGYSTMADTEAICRLISMALRSSVPVGHVIKQLRGIGGAAQVFSGKSRVFSIPDAIAQVLQRHFGDEVTGAPVDDESMEVDICPDCASVLMLDSGCLLCSACGYSSC